MTRPRPEDCSAVHMCFSGNLVASSCRRAGSTSKKLWASRAAVPQIVVWTGLQPAQIGQPGRSRRCSAQPPILSTFHFAHVVGQPPYEQLECVVAQHRCIRAAFVLRPVSLAGMRYERAVMMLPNGRDILDAIERHGSGRVCKYTSTSLADSMLATDLMYHVSPCFWWRAGG